MTTDALEQATAGQRRAADPATSAFVSANAGSGKTRVLTNRVARLLLAGSPPEKILCVTFTKAAAAEMAERLFDLLGGWAFADDAALAAPLDDLEGPPARGERGAPALARARRLFAQALETPGGLKIQTIHSFCDSVLKRFPLEARASPGFSVLEEAAATALKVEAFDAAARMPALAAAFARLSAVKSPETIRETALAALGDARRLRRLRADVEGVRFAAALGVAPDHDPGDAIRFATADPALAPDRLTRLAEAFAAGGKKAGERADELRKALVAASDDGRFAALTDCFLTKEGEPRSQLVDKPGKAFDPGAADLAAEAQAAVVAGEEARRAGETLVDARALAAIVDEMAGEYARAKTARAALDFDDLIDGARRLFATETSAWVMYKLDRGLDHVLLDEAQDTSPDAWDVLDGPLREFFAGDGAAAAGRTFFAVGDRKQSIYSFQGADAALFGEKEQELGKRIAAVAPYANVPMALSFRTTAPVLRFVDEAFADPEALEGVDDARPLRPGVHRVDAPGAVELWPLAPAPEKVEVSPWDAPLDARVGETPARRLAVAVAAEIADWLKTGAPNPSRGRPISPGDVMLLVQSRSALFHEAIAALSRAGVPVAGADKLRLLDDQGVKDLMSLARAALYAGDCLSHAEALRGPFCDVDEDALFDLAHGRRGRLADAIAARADERAEWRAAADFIDAARARAAAGPVAFFAGVLEEGEPAGWRRLFARLGPAAREPVEELLRLAHDFEAGAPRSLRSFISWATANAGDVSRDAGEGGDVVRVMTAHKAKGLEADIVFLLDARRAKRTTERIYDVAPDAAPVLATKAPSAALVEAKAAAARRAAAEHRRLFYVAATRARDRLYVCGVEDRRTSKPAKGKPVDDWTWRDLAEAAFERLADDVRTVGERWERPVLRLGAAAEAREAAPAPAAASKTPPLPNFLFERAPAEAPPARLSPTRLADLVEHTEDARPDSAYAPAPAGGVDAYARGAAIHRLLEILPDVPPADRAGAADRLLARSAAGTDDATRAAWREEALRVLADEAFAAAFAPGGRAEAAIAGDVEVDGRTLRVHGRIDRLVVADGAALIVDYKTNRPPPAEPHDAPAAYLAQMGAYRALATRLWPGRRVAAALVWTYAPRLMALPDALIDEAFQKAARRFS
ncbi:MAG: double-strand break repair helicase AddA [Parvularculaceae bacterium]